MKKWSLAWRTMSGRIDRIVENEDSLEIGAAYGQMLLDLMGEAHCHAREGLSELVVLEGDRTVMSGGWYAV